MKGAKSRDSGRWSCEVGANTQSPTHQGRTGHWALEGEIDIEVRPAVTVLEETSDTLTGAIQANTTLLVICVVVFCIFLSILISVVIMYGRSRLRQRVPRTTDSILIKEEPKLAGDFIRRVLPHIIKFPIKENQVQ